MVAELRHLLFAVLMFCTLLSAGCSTQRRQFAPGEIPQITDVSEADEQYGHEVLNMMMDQYTLDREDQHISRVRTIVDKLAESANSNSAPWHVYVFADDSVENAAATRGDYIFVWTGILNKVRNDDELAAVLAHEISHVLAGHTQPTPAEEYSQMISEVSGEVTSQVISSQGNIGILANLAGSLTKALIESMIINPEEQRKELEADQIGLFLMAKANYDPKKSVEFWERMNNEGFGDLGPVQFLTSHPDSQARLEQLNRLLPEAQKLQESIHDSGSDAKNIYKSEWTINTGKKLDNKNSLEKNDHDTSIKSKDELPSIESKDTQKMPLSQPTPW